MESSMSTNSCPIEDKIYWENCYDDEAIDYLNPESFLIAPPPINMPVAHWKYLGRERFQPIFKRIRTADSNIVIKLLEERLYEKAIDLICKNYAKIETSETSCTEVKVPKESTEMLIGLFNEGHSLIAYDLTHQEVLGVLIARIHVTGQDIKIPLQTSRKHSSLLPRLKEPSPSEGEISDGEKEKPNLRFPSSIYFRKQERPEYVKANEVPRKRPPSSRRAPDSLVKFIPHVQRISRKTLSTKQIINNKTHYVPKNLRFNEVIYEENVQKPKDKLNENQKSQGILKNSSLEAAAPTNRGLVNASRSVLQKDGPISKGISYGDNLEHKNILRNEIDGSFDDIKPVISVTGKHDDPMTPEEAESQYNESSVSSENFEISDEENKKRSIVSKFSQRYEGRKKYEYTRTGSCLQFDDKYEVDEAYKRERRYRGTPRNETFLINDLQRIFENCKSDGHECYKVKRDRLLEELKIKKYYYIHHLSVDYDFLKPETLFLGLINGLMLWANFIRPAEELDAVMAVPRIDAYPWIFVEAGFKKIMQTDKFEFLDVEDNELPYRHGSLITGKIVDEACFYVGLCGQYTKHYWDYMGTY